MSSRNDSHSIDPKYRVVDRAGNFICYLNPVLANRNKVSDENLAALRLSHIVREKLFNMARKTKDSRKLKAFAELFEELEFEQQRLWGFPQDRNFHRWFDLPGCTCPKMDNEDAYSTDRRIVMHSCPAHGRRK